MRVGLVAGSLVISMNTMAWTEVTTLLTMGRMGVREEAVNGEHQHKLFKDFNCTHYIHHVRFGTPFPYAHDQPLENRYNHIENSFSGIALEQLEVKLVPTFQAGVIEAAASSFQQPMYQTSVNVHQVEPATLVQRGVPQLPGLWLAYDFSPIAVRHSGGRDNILVFTSSLISIVGGVFVTVGMLTSCLVHSAKAVSKKVD
mmetsp:Transcript_7261/g.9469  ORF Transcript_7261/g.9469 Transcript_7261/m.9469 type:complete len:200 (+) Transcript_7261:1-600(+)